MESVKKDNLPLDNRSNLKKFKCKTIRLAMVSALMEKVGQQGEAKRQAPLMRH
jgi:hypothetical protein